MLGLISPTLAADSTKAKEPAKAEAKEKDAKAKPSKVASPEDQLLSSSLSSAQRTKLLIILNTGDDEALMALPSIGTVRAAAIKAARPFAQPTDLIPVAGIGRGTFKGIINHAKADFPAPAPKAKAPAKKKATPKKPEEATKK